MDLATQVGATQQSRLRPHQRRVLSRDQAQRTPSPAPLPPPTHVLAFSLPFIRVSMPFTLSKDFTEKQAIMHSGETCVSSTREDFCHSPPNQETFGNDWRRF